LTSGPGLHQAENNQQDADAIARALRLALEKAEAFAGATAPNPPVGCAILDAAGQVLACEAHRKAGLPHAEALAIAACRDNGLTDRIDTVVVTLEPCNHFGRTPPCVDAILGTPARRVVVGALDPNPRVDGNGLQRLAARGLTVSMIDTLNHPDAAELAAACRRLIAPFAKHALTGMPWVTVKRAFDRTGGMIPPAGRKTFTSPESLILAHRLRRRADAIMTGSGTILADLPEFTVRHLLDHPGKRRQLVILDRRARVPAHYIDEARARSFDVSIETDLTDALANLGEAGALEVLVEAGPTLTDAVLAAGLWDEDVTIRQGDPDRVSIRTRHDIVPTQKADAHVLRHR
jgi:diaminohydroxyphosphoribosylaminopyrimidine deaminase/5-amino-6-(5-phosphoribosylamino)uracil reductase